MKQINNKKALSPILGSGILFAYLSR